MRATEGRPKLNSDVDSWHHHAKSDHLRWNESAWFGFMVPERNINGWLYYWHRPHMQLTAGGLAVWDDTGKEQHDCLYHDWFPFYIHPAEGDHFNFSVDDEAGGGFEISSDTPLEQYEVKFQKQDVSLELAYQALSEPQADDFGAPNSVSFGSFHYDQLAYVKGILNLRGEEIEIDCVHMRDRSWGVRKAFPPGLRGGLDLGHSDAGVTFVGSMFSADPIEDPSTTTEHLTYGHLAMDGVVSPGVSGTRTTYRGAGAVAERIEMQMTDADGRTVEAVGSPINVLHYDNLWRTDWSLMRWDSINGSPGWGECQDFADRELWRGRSRSGIG